MPPSLGDNIILENGTIKTGKVAMMDLAFWLPLAASYEASPMRWCKICTFVWDASKTADSSNRLHTRSSNQNYQMHIFDQDVLL